MGGFRGGSCAFLFVVAFMLLAASPVFAQDNSTNTTTAIDTSTLFTDTATFTATPTATFTATPTSTATPTPAAQTSGTKTPAVTPKVTPTPTATATAAASTTTTTGLAVGIVGWIIFSFLVFLAIWDNCRLGYRNTMEKKIELKA